MNPNTDLRNRVRLSLLHVVTVLAVLFAHAPPALSQALVRVEEPVQPTSIFTPENGEWHCVSSRGQLLDLAFTGIGVRINNITITQTTDFMTRQQVIRLGASVVNPTMARAAVSLEAIGIAFAEDGSAYPSFAMSTREQWGSVQAGSSQEISSTTYATTESEAATQFCVRPFITQIAG